MPAGFSSLDARFAALLGLILALGALALPARTHAAPVYGVSILEEPPSSDYQRMGTGGVDVMRIVLSWAHVQPMRSGGFQWRHFDRVVAATARAGVQVLPILYGSPGWAVSCGQLGEVECRRKPPLESADSRAAWQRFVGAAVERYGPNGTFWSSRVPSPPDAEVPEVGDPTGAPPALPPLGPPPYLPITRWQVWNEPSSPTYWKPGHPDAKRYAQLVRISNIAISAKDPAAEVLLAGLFGTPFGGEDERLIVWRYLGRMYRVNGIERHFDAVALHPYAPNMRGIAHQLRRVRAVMRRHGDAETPVWITEIGWGSANPSEGPLLKGPEGQANQLRTAFTRLGARAPWNVAGILWFDWRDPAQYVDGCTSPFCLSAGLIAESGREKPAWAAFTEFAGGTP